MSLKAFVKRCLMEYFIITTCVTAAIGVLGLSLDPRAKIGYEGYFSPLIFGLVSLVPSVATYSRKELTFRQALIRKLFHFVLLEAMLIAFGHWAGILYCVGDTASFSLAVFIVYLAVNLISWHLDSREACEINKTLKALQGRK
jgi:hypothetical protein